MNTNKQTNKCLVAGTEVLYIEGCDGSSLTWILLNGELPYPFPLQNVCLKLKTKIWIKKLAYLNTGF